jgi:hypothetical protein
MKNAFGMIAAVTLALAGCGGSSAPGGATGGAHIQACLRDTRGFQEVAVQFPKGPDLLSAHVKFAGPTGALEGAADLSNSGGLLTHDEGGPVRGHFTCQIVYVESYGKKAAFTRSMLGTGGPSTRRIGGAGPVVTGKT